MKRWKRILTLALALICTLSVPPASAKQPSSTDDLKKEIEALKDVMKSVQKDIQEIKSLLQSRQPTSTPPPRNVVLDIGRNHFKGERDAKVTLIEISDYQCPFCGKHARETSPQITKDYVATGKLKYVFMDLPLSMHPLAFKAAEAANCAGEQGKYWEMHDRLFANQQTLEPWKAHAEAVGLDAAKFEACLTSGKQAEEVRTDMAEAQKAGVTATPLFFLGYTDPKGSEVKTVVRFSGAQPYSAFKEQIDRLLAEQPKTNPARAVEKAK